LARQLWPDLEEQINVDGERHARSFELAGAPKRPFNRFEVVRSTAVWKKRTAVGRAGLGWCWRAERWCSSSGSIYASFVVAEKAHWKTAIMSTR
jgi:hypothetical protein